MALVAHARVDGVGRRWLASWGTREAGAAWLFMLPALVGLFVFHILPLWRAVGYTFTDFDLFSDPTNVGLDNYSRLFSDDQFLRAIRLTATYVVINVPVQVGIALGLAAILDKVTASILVRAVLILPFLISNVVAGLVWLWILDPAIGIVNHFLDLVGVGSQAFLGSETQAIPTIAFINVWRHLGFSTLLLVAGIATIDRALYEAAKVDGASEWQQFRRVTVPMLRPVLLFVTVTSVVGSLQIFDTIAVTTEGGPGGATRVFMWYIYELAFKRFDFGYATTLAVALFVIAAIVSVLQFRVFGRDNRA
ncbi:MAG: sugar ABC transporter permease [Acidimicrobiia bacterium]|nr:sugar ABC transporter permease [Acidimicrobiia bacterium]MDQ3499513.1 sugar ABC transporter permease [Actinomycetota bacterium]